MFACNSNAVKSIMLTAAVVGLAACGNISTRVAKDGRSAQQLVWPDPGKVSVLHKGGSFPEPAAVRLVKAGMNKQQIMQLLGAPQFNEGLVAVREWDYLFNFRQRDSDVVTQCQYKILFDRHKLAQSFYWKPESCAAILERPKPVTTTTVTTSTTPLPHSETFTLSSDSVFAFGKSDAAHISAGGLVQLDHIVSKVGTGSSRLHIVGYTDRLGSDSYNQTLSENRANTVLQILQDKGIAASRMDASGRGKANPVTSCDNKQRKALIACLAPNRRVEVRVEGQSDAN